MNPAKLKDQEIVNIIRTGSPSDKERVLMFLYKQTKWRRTVKGMILGKKLGSEEDAMDVLHEGFAKFEENIRLGKFQGNSNLNTYLIAICKNIWLRRFDKNTRYHKLQESLAKENHTQAYNLKTTMEQEEDHRQTEERKKLLHQLIEKLGEKCKVYLELYMQDYTTAQMVALTDLKNDVQVRKATYNCRLRLRKLILADPQLLHYLKTNTL